MSKISLFDTSFAKAARFNDQATKATKFIAANRTNLIPSDNMVRLLSKKSFILTPISQLFEHLHNENKTISLFAPVQYAGIKSGVPEILTMPAITLDSKQMHSRDILSVMSEYRDRTIVNLTHLLKAVGYNSFELADLTELQNLYVRSALVMSYEDFPDMWLTPTLQTYILKTYSMTISSILGRIYTLDLQEQVVLSMLMSLFYALKMSSDHGTIPSQIWSCTYLGNRYDIKNMLDNLNIDLNKFDTLEDLSNTLVSNGPAQMKSLSPDMFIRYTTSYGTDAISMAIALEYPPYWIHQVLRAIGGDKIALLHHLKNNRLIDEGKVFHGILNTSKFFIDKLNRQ